MNPITSLGGSGSGQVGRYDVKHAFSRLVSPGWMGGASASLLALPRLLFLVSETSGFWVSLRLLWPGEEVGLGLPKVTRAYLGLYSFLAIAAEGGTTVAGSGRCSGSGSASVATCRRSAELEVV